MKRKLIPAAFAAASLMGLVSVAQAAPAVVAGTPYAPGTTYVQFAPPSPVYEPAPEQRHGYVWAAGHYEFRDGQYVWVPGHWMTARPGYVWQDARWQRDRNGQWYLTEGTWIRTDTTAYDRGNGRRGPQGDLDGDGIMNRHDDDRDGDGVANWMDNFPNNWNRS